MPTQMLGKKYRLTYKVTKVTVNEDKSIDAYKKINAKDLKEVLDDVNDEKRWTFDFEFDEKNGTIKRVKSVTWPAVDGRTGHVHGSGGWKYHIDRTRRSEDRLVLEKWKATVKNFENKGVGKLKGVTELEADVDVTVTARALADTHS